MDMIITTSLHEYEHFLDESEGKLIYIANSLKQKFSNYDWNDNIYCIVKNALNAHFDSMDEIIENLESIKSGISQIAYLEDEYNNIGL